MIDGQIKPIPPCGDNAYGNGFLNKSFANVVINRANRPLLIALPPGAPGAKVIQSEENVVIDLSKQQFGINDSLWIAVDGVAHPFGLWMKRIG